MLYAIILLFFSTTLILLYLNFKKSKKLKSFRSDLDKILSHKKRNGYYIEKLKKTDLNGKVHSFNATVFITEIEKYSDNKSKVKITSIEPGVSTHIVNKNVIENFIKDNFKSIVKTSDIHWLEVEKNILIERRKKLKKLKDSLM